MIHIFIRDKNLSENVKAINSLRDFYTQEYLQELYYKQVQADLGVETRKEVFDIMGVPIEYENIKERE